MASALVPSAIAGAIYDSVLHPIDTRKVRIKMQAENRIRLSKVLVRIAREGKVTIISLLQAHRKSQKDFVDSLEV